MKKIFISISLLLLAALPASAAAPAEINLNSADNNYTVGQKITLTISIDAKGAPYDTVAINGKFPADLLEIQTMLPNSLFSTMSPDNAYDNTKGTFSFGGGIAGGSTAAADLGTIIFKVKNHGNAVVSLTGDSAIITAGEVISSPAERSVSFSLAKTPVPAPLPKPAKTTPVKTTAKTPINTQSAPASSRQAPDQNNSAAGLAIPVVSAAQPQNYNIYYTYLAELIILLAAGAGAALTVAYYVKKKNVKKSEEKIHKFDDNFKI